MRGPVTKTVAIVQARLGSTRLPNKVLRKIGDYTMLECVVKRLRRCRNIDQIVVATPGHSKAIDDELMRINAMGFRYGFDPADLLGRHLDAARALSADLVVRVPSDNPLVDPVLVDRIIDHVAQVEPLPQHVYVDHAWPNGLGCEVYRTEDLAWLDNQELPFSNREHLHRWFVRHHMLLRVGEPLPYGWMRLDVNTIDDLTFMRTLEHGLADAGHDWLTVTASQIFDWLARHPKVEPLYV